MSLPFGYPVYTLRDTKWGMNLEEHDILSEAATRFSPQTFTSNLAIPSEPGAVRVSSLRSSLVSDRYIAVRHMCARSRIV
jgi:hypothetical protein